MVPDEIGSAALAFLIVAALFRLVFECFGLGTPEPRQQYPEHREWHFWAGAIPACLLAVLLISAGRALVAGPHTPPVTPCKLAPESLVAIG
jgi:hypothetical protein